MLVLGALPGRTQAPPPVDLKVVKYDALAQEIGKLKGKVVLVDVWANW
jgi:hypothetical protein